MVRTISTSAAGSPTKEVRYRALLIPLVTRGLLLSRRGKANYALSVFWKKEFGGFGAPGRGCLIFVFLFFPPLCNPSAELGGGRLHSFTAGWSASLLSCAAIC